MKIGDICSRDVFVVAENEPLANAVREMDARHVGAIVVAESNDGVTRPVGIVTDRDVLRGQFHRNADLFCLTAGDVMTNRPFVLHEDCELGNAIELMSSRVVRRAPVVNKEGSLVGIVSFDDLLPAVAENLGAIAKLLGTQAAREHS